MPFPADISMSDEENKAGVSANKTPPSMGNDWGSGKGSGRMALFNGPEEFDIYCDRGQSINYIFHGKPLDCTIDYLEYDHDTQRITVFTNDRQQLDLGSKIEWLVRPYIAKEQNLFIIRTENGKAIDGIQVHLKIKDPEIQKNSDKNLN